MSQHYFETKIGSEDCMLMMGWDSPTQTIYALFSTLNKNKTSWREPFIFDETIPLDRDQEIDSLDHIIAQLKVQFEFLGLCAPSSMFDSVKEDIVSDAVNDMHQHFADKQSINIEISPFEDHILEQRLLNDPAASYWLKEQIQASKSRDPIKTLNEVELFS